MSEQKVTIQQLKAIARENYENGGDFVIECWDDNDLAQFIADHPDDPVAALRRVMSGLDDHRRDIEATAF